MDFCCDNTHSHTTQWLPSVTTKSQERDPTLSHAHLKKKKINEERNLPQLTGFHL
jgi:hypothetical protein